MLKVLSYNDLENFIAGSLTFFLSKSKVIWDLKLRLVLSSRISELETKNVQHTVLQVKYREDRKNPETGNINWNNPDSGHWATVSVSGIYAPYLLTGYVSIENDD